MRTLAILFVLLLVIGFSLVILTPPPAKGEGCVTRSRVVVSSGYGYSDYVVKKKVVVVDPVAVAVAIPAYFAAYLPPPPAPVAPPAPPAPPAGPSGDTKAILDAIKGLGDRQASIEARLSRLEGGTPKPPTPVDPFAPKPPAPKAEAPKNPGLGAMQAKCASCHEAKVAKDKGGALTLFDGPALAELGERTKRKVLGAAYKGSMPPKDSGVPALTDEEVGAIVAHLDK